LVSIEHLGGLLLCLVLSGSGLALCFGPQPDQYQCDETLRQRKAVFGELVDRELL
jgi:hypothetical protein